MRIVWFILGGLSLTLGIVGAFLPLLPTVPLLLLAAFFFSKSSKRAHDWLIHHKTLGPPIKDWGENGVIKRRAKVISSISMAAVIGISAALELPAWVIGIQVIILSVVSIFIWTRPEN